jgi:hypothetical protein
MVLEEDENEATMSASYASGEEQPPLFVRWKILLASVSGLNVSGLSVTGEQYKPYANDDTHSEGEEGDKVSKNDNNNNNHRRQHDTRIHKKRRII